MKTSVNTGNFSVVVSGDLIPEKQDAIIANGVLYDLQRGGLSAAYLALGGVANEKGKLRLPAGFERSSVDFSDEAVEVMQEAISEWAKKLFVGEAEISVTKYEGSEADSPMKRATALVDSFLGTEKEAPFRAILGNGDRDSLIQKANEMKLGITPPRAPKAAVTTEEAPVTE